jgi:uncharacterized delta-60 repeat protein
MFIVCSSSLYPDCVSDKETSDAQGKVVKNNPSQNQAEHDNHIDSPVRRFWVRRYNGPGNYVDATTALAVDSQDNVVVTGYSTKDSFDYCTIKYSPTGEQLWVQRYDGTGHSSDYPTAITVDSQDNIIVSGYSQSEGSGDDFVTIKYSPSGQQLWTKQYNGIGNGGDCPMAIGVDAKGSVYVAGAEGFYCTLIKYSSEGRLLWVRHQGEGSVTAMALDDAGNVYITGFARNPNNSYNDYVTAKYNPAGSLRWLRRYDGPGHLDDIATSLAVDAQKNVYVTGYSKGLQNDYDCATIKYNSDGMRLWVRRYNGPGNYHDAGNAIALDQQQNVYVAGYSWGTCYDFLTLRACA